ncbi:exo-alpha-sialidase [Ruminococcus sp. OA3]|uniref:WD40/YVTN/BNR-like repeat-containing protein n=1 Tax=Ruminococcus sp. OA3 TaxID=2914164 RepID=UPI001F062C1D|nr:exo-alpha-sialidase [Ruminococcus sp. OA3]MCH1980991.1 exo-alpha-sialidase [Ruminococcus sp. OA3]
MFTKDSERTRFQVLLSMVFHPVFLIVYGIAWYHLCALCRYGGKRRHLPVLAVCALFFLVWLIVCIIRIVKKQDAGHPYQILSAARKAWYIAAFLSLCAVTGYFGWGIVKSAGSYQGKLSWVLEEARHRRTVILTHDNIYRDGIEGLLADIREEIDMPGELYVATSVDLEFDSGGRILKLDTFLYGKNEEGKTNSFLISYDRSKAEEMTVYLDGAVNTQDEQGKQLAPLMSMLKVMPLEQTVSGWEAPRFGILYYGIRSWGTDTSGIVYINSAGNTRAAVNGYCEISGYTVSVYVPDTDGEPAGYPPVRYVYADDLNAVASENPLSAQESVDMHDSTEGQESDEDMSMLDESRGYRLTVLDAAAGSRFYGLEMTVDGGESWEILNQDPFCGDIGVSAGISFLNETLGFLALSHSGGSLAELYRTEDGGATFERVTLPAVKVPLNGGEMYQPFDFPGMPYEEDGTLYLKVGQGQDGDYNGGSSALYTSADKGRTWSYQREVARDE